jgi:hypothetical protein
MAQNGATVHTVAGAHTELQHANQSKMAYCSESGENVVACDEALSEGDYTSWCR